MSATKSALDKLIASISSHWPTLTPKAAAELSQLRADLQAAQERIVALTADRDDYAAQLTQSRIDLVRANERSEEQERQLDEAREIFENIFKRDWTNTKINDKARDWLAANPAPQEPLQ